MMIIIRLWYRPQLVHACCAEHTGLWIPGCACWTVRTLLGLEEADGLANYLEKCTLTLSAVVKLFIGLGSGVPPIEKTFCSKFSANICKSVLGFLLQQ